MGTFKDISLFGSYCFHTEGELAGRVVAQSVAGRGKVCSKKTEEMSQIAGRQVPIARATGAETVKDEPLIESDLSGRPTPTANSGSYAIRFIQHAAEERPAQAALSPIEDNRFAAVTQLKGFVIKHGGAKRTLFTQAQ